MTPKIHFILPSGGAKGCFQAGFLYQLFTQYSNMFSIYQVDGISIGAINGLSLFGDIEKIKDIWLSIKNKDDLFSSLSNSYIFNDFFSYLYSFNNMSIFDNKNIKEFIYNYPIDYTNIHKYNCGVVNLNKGHLEYINGSNELIKDYVIGSSSPWILSPPCKINNTYYTDGGLLELYPSKYILNSKADLIVIVGYDSNYNKLTGDIGNNIFTYLERIIEVSMYTNIQKNIDFINNLHLNKLLIVENTSNIDILNFTQDDLKNGFNQGIESLEKFMKDYQILSNI